MQHWILSFSSSNISVYFSKCFFFYELFVKEQEFKAFLLTTWRLNKFTSCTHIWFCFPLVIDCISFWTWREVLVRIALSHRETERAAKLQMVFRGLYSLPHFHFLHYISKAFLIQTFHSLVSTVNYVGIHLCFNDCKKNQITVVFCLKPDLKSTCKHVHCAQFCILLQ